MKRNPVFIYLFEATNILGCIIFPCMLIFDFGGKFYPTGSAYTPEDVMVCIRNMVIASVVFAVFIGVPLLLLFVDCFVIMRGVKGFQVSALSVLTAPASYPILRTEILQDPPGKRRFHIIAGGIIFCSNCLVIIAFVQYILRIAAVTYNIY